MATLTGTFTRPAIDVAWPADMPWPTSEDAYVDTNYKNTGMLLSCNGSFSDDNLRWIWQLEFDTIEHCSAWVYDPEMAPSRQIRNDYCDAHGITVDLNYPVGW